MFRARVTRVTRSRARCMSPSVRGRIPRWTTHRGRRAAAVIRAEVGRRHGRARRPTLTDPRLDAARRRHGAEPRRPRRPHASRVRVHPPDRTPDRRARPSATRPAARRCTSAVGPGRWPATSRPPARLGPAGRGARRRRWPSSSRCRLPADGLGFDLQVVDAPPGSRPGRRPVNLVVARRLRRRPHPRPPQLGGVRRARRPLLSPGGTYAANLADGGRARCAGSQLARGPRRLRHVVVRRCRTSCAGAGSATSCWSAAGARLPVDELARRRRPIPSPHVVEPGADLDRVHRGGPHRSPRPCRRPDAAAGGYLGGARTGRDSDLRRRPLARGAFADVVSLGALRRT